MLCRVLLTDSYKTTHNIQYPPGTDTVYSYFEARGPLIIDGEIISNEMTFFGLQMLIKKYILPRVTKEEVEYGFARLAKHIGPHAMQNKQAWLDIVNELDGKFPVEIKAVPEGTSVGYHNVLLTVKNTGGEKYRWCTSYIETLLVQLWYPTTVCTLSKSIKNLILEGLEKTGDPGRIDFKLHDFGMRGSTSIESSAIGGLAHLVNFMGTDTMSALMAAEDYYSCDMAGFSIPAAEHSTITSWGRENEAKAYENMLDQFKGGIVAVVSDSYDIRNACVNLWGKELKSKVLEHGENKGVLVVRPDSGEPDLSILNTLTDLSKKFGYIVNDKGFKELPSYLSVIHGDGINYESMKRIIYTLISNQWSLNSVAFGCGGALLQKHNRDSANFAFKCSMVSVNGKERDVYKAPYGSTIKASKRGRLKLVKRGDTFETVSADGPGDDELRTVYLNGELLVDETLDTIRKRSKR